MLFFTATVLSQWLLLNYISSLIYENSADLKITPDCSAHLETNGVADSPNPSTPEHRIGSFTAVGYWNTIFMGALFLHVWSAPKQSICWDVEYLSSVATFALRQNGVNEFKKSWCIGRSWAVLLGARYQGFH